MDGVMRTLKKTANKMLNAGAFKTEVISDKETRTLMLKAILPNDQTVIDTVKSLGRDCISTIKNSGQSIKLEVQTSKGIEFRPPKPGEDVNVILTFRVKPQ